MQNGGLPWDYAKEKEKITTQGGKRHDGEGDFIVTRRRASLNSWEGGGNAQENGGEMAAFQRVYLLFKVRGCLTRKNSGNRPYYQKKNRGGCGKRGKRCPSSSIYSGRETLLCIC